MALADFDAYNAALTAARSVVASKAAIGGPGAWLTLSVWTNSPKPGGAPTTAAVPTVATSGAVEYTPTTAVQRVARLVSSNTPAIGAYLLCDRLSHQGGLSGVTTGAQTTNLPTAALTRYTSGVGVVAAIEIYTAVGATPQILTAVYTNQAGTGSRVTKVIAFGGSGNQEVQKIFILPLQDGDTGVRSVESVEISASTGTAGNFGVVLLKPLALVPARNRTGQVHDSIIGLGAQMPVIAADACLQLVLSFTGATTGVYAVEMKMIEE